MLVLSVTNYICQILEYIHLSNEKPMKFLSAYPVLFLQTIYLSFSLPWIYISNFNKIKFPTHTSEPWFRCQPRKICRFLIICTDGQLPIGHYSFVNVGFFLYAWKCKILYTIFFYYFGFWIKCIFILKQTKYWSRL